MYVSSRRGQRNRSHHKKVKLFLESNYEKELEMYTYCEPQIVLNSLELVIMQITISLTSQINFSFVSIFNSMSESGTLQG